jgi:LuxR family quorum-sensing transcriptional regulator LasR
MREQYSLDALEAFLNAPDESALIECTRRYARQLGFDYFVYGVQIVQPFAKPQQHICNGYPETWRVRYDANRYVEIDPTVQHCIRSTIPLLWTDDVFIGPAKALWEEARAHGLNYGLSCPVHDRMGTTGILSLARDRPLNMREDVLTELLAIAQLLASFIHAGVNKVVVPELLKGMRPHLTARETECLKWAAEGKTAWEISRIIGISERTAIFHLSNAVQKLGATNRAQAVARAVFLSVI